MAEGWSFEDLTKVDGAGEPSGGGTPGYVWEGDPNGSSLHFVYVGTDQHIHEKYKLKDWSGWAHNDLTRAADAPDARQGGTPAAYAWEHDPKGTGQSVFYVGEDLHVHQIFMRRGGSGWTHYDVFDDTGASLGALVRAGGDVSAYIWDKDPAGGSSQHLVFVGGDSRIHEFYTRGTGGWAHHDLTSAGKSDLPLSINVHGYVWDGDSEGSSQHVLYTSSLDHHVHELFFGTNNRAWVDHDLNSYAGGADVLAGGTPYGYAWDRNPGSPSQHVVYQGTDQHVHMLWFNNRTRDWHHDDLTSVTGAPNTLSTPFGWVWDTSGFSSGTCQNVAYWAFGGIAVPTMLGKLHVMTYYTDAPPWKDVDLQEAGGQFMPASMPRSLAWNTMGTNHVTYAAALVNHFWEASDD